MKREASMDARIVVPGSLNDPHQLIDAAHRSLRSSKVNEQGVLQSRTKRRLDIRVTPGTLERALLVGDTLIKALEERGCPVQVAKTEPHLTSATVLNEKIHFCIEEKIRQVEHKPTDKDKDRKSSIRWYSRPQYDYEPTGQLRFVVLDGDRLGVRRTWSDGKKQRLENCLNKFIAGLALIAEACKAERARQEEMRAAWERDARRNKELQEKRWEKERRVEVLESQLRRWKKGSTNARLRHRSRKRWRSISTQ